MKSAGRTGVAAVALALGAALAAGREPAQPDVARGLQLYEQGDLKGALEALDPALRRLSSDPARAADLALAHLYMGLAYAGLEQDKAARASFREALRLDRGLTLEERRFPARSVRLFEEARAELRPVAAATPAPASWIERAARLPALGEERARRLVGAHRRLVVAVTRDDGAGGRRAFSGILVENLGRTVVPLELVAGTQLVDLRLANGLPLRAQVEPARPASRLAVLNPVYYELALAQAAIQNPPATALFSPLSLGDPGALSAGDPIVVLGAGDEPSGVVVGALKATPTAGDPGAVLALDAATPPSLAGAPWLDANGRIVGLGLSSGQAVPVTLERPTLLLEPPPRPAKPKKR